MSDSAIFTIHTDGAARGNPGPAAYAYVIERPGAPAIEVSRRLGLATNNIAEYTALVKAIEHARRLGARRLQLFSDSELMVKQLNGDYRVKHPGLLPLYEEARDLLSEFEQATIRHVRREDNAEADRLCNQALDGWESPDGAPLEKETALPERKRRAGTRSDAEALAYLTNQAALWSRGDPGNPDPAQVLAELRKKLLKK